MAEFTIKFSGDGVTVSGDAVTLDKSQGYIIEAVHDTPVEPPVIDPPGPVDPPSTGRTSAGRFAGLVSAHCRGRRPTNTRAMRGCPGPLVRSRTFQAGQLSMLAERISRLLRV